MLADGSMANLAQGPPPKENQWPQTRDVRSDPDLDMPEWLAQALPRSMLQILMIPTGAAAFHPS